MKSLARVGLLVVLVTALVGAQSRVTSPLEELGFNFGDDYHLANYTQIAAYWQKLARESPRIAVQEIGRTAEGRPHLMAIVTSPENHKNLARYKEIARRLALAEGLNDEAARALAREGKAVVWIDGGLHASETLGAQQLGEMVYQMVTRTDEETMRILNDVIALFVHANPDGNELVANWYMRNPVPDKRSLASLPRLYQKYIGHDNNRDFYASTQPETENMNRVLYHEWFPQILYNHHQSGPAGTVLWSPPLRDPFNYNQDPLLVLGLQSLGVALHQRLAAEGKPGATMRSGGPYDGWWNGGIRNTAAFHNIIAILTETIGSPTPMRVPLVMPRQLPSSDLAFPIAPQPWRFRQSVEYSITNNRAVLDYASRWRETLLFNIYRMGMNSIERGSRDTWTPRPHRLAEVAAKMDASSGGRGLSTGLGAGGRGGAAVAADREAAYLAELRKPEWRDPRGFIIPSNQPDFLTATKFINALRETGIMVHRAVREFEVQGKTYPAGSYVVLAAQAFRPHVMDMFEPQDHPDNFPYPGAPPIPPYDYAGWTLAFQMGIEFDRILDPFSGPFERITEWNVKPPAGTITQAKGAAGYVIDRRVLDSFAAVNRLLVANEEVYWLQGEFNTGTRRYGPGAWYVRARPSTPAALQKLAEEIGISAEAATVRLPAGALRVRRPRIGLWDQYGGSIDAGWARWIFEQFEFAYERVFPQALDAGNLNAKYDVLVFVEGGIPSQDGVGGGGRGGGQPDPGDVPEEYRPHLGRVTRDRTLPQIRQFIENGGTVLALGDSGAHLAALLGLPVGNHLIEGGQPLPSTKCYVPASVLAARVDIAHPLGHGMKERTDVFFDNSPVFTSGPDAGAKNLQVVAWFDSKTPLRSGWAWGQHYLEGGALVVDAPLGKGRVVLLGPEVLKRAQPHGTFKFVFNGIYLAVAGSDRDRSGVSGPGAGR